MKKKTRKTSADGFTCPSGSPFAAEHARLDELLATSLGSKFRAETTKMEKSAQLRLLMAATERIEFQKQQKNPRASISELIQTLTGRKLPYQDEDVCALLSCAARIHQPADPENVAYEEYISPVPGLVPVLVEYSEAAAQQRPLSKEWLADLSALHAALKPMEFWGGYGKTVRRLAALIEQKPAGLPDEGEAWADAIRQDIAAMPAAARDRWEKLLRNAPKGTTAKPTAQWKKQADELLAAAGKDKFARQIELWFGLVGSRATERIQPRNAAMLRGLTWYASLLTGEDVCRALANAVEGGLRKLPQGGLYASSISKACIAALEAMPGLEPIAQLSRLKHRVKSPWGLEEIQNAFAKAVQRSGLAAVEVEEITVPTFGFENGKLPRGVGKNIATLSITGTHEIAVEWTDSQGSTLADEPKIPKTAAAELKALKLLVKDIQRMLGAQRDRIEGLLNTGRSWLLPTWRERFSDHALLGHLSRRLLWQFREGAQQAAGFWRDGKFAQSSGKPIGWLSPKTEVRLWHPIGCDPEAVLAWRVWLERRQITQPFKQAHREVYVLTDAERRTGTYSNRFAAHILRQHQFKALCDQRGWHYEFLGSWDGGGHAGATLELPQWSLRAEFWIDGAGGESAASGVDLHVASDQVRFVGANGKPVALAAVPALVFSEVMRDVDLFVGVCSVAADPTWTDQADRPHRDYWHKWAAGDLNATAQTRRDVMLRLLPKLKIADQCSVSEKFLVVKGSLRTYKIHLGSANIFMEPNDEYLCVVADRGKTRPKDEVFLPFEGDSTFALILSKAFLLADDSKIQDGSILNQIRKASK